MLARICRPTSSSRNILNAMQLSRARNFSTRREFKVSPFRPNLDLYDMGVSTSVIKPALEIIQYFASPNKYLAEGINPPKGIIVSGEPGTGKSMLAKAIAGHAGVPLLLISGSELIGEFVGEGERLLRELFETARKIAPCIICVDEIDSLAIGRFRSPKFGGELHHNTMVNQFLTLLDQANLGVVVIVTTNHYKSLDQAFVRPGRFDKHIVMSLPNKKDREKILAIHTKNKKLDPNLQLSDLAILSAGFSGAKLAAWVNEAVIVAVREGSPLSADHFTGVLNELELGSLIINEEQSLDKAKLIAIHEAGHALVAHLLGEKVYQISILKYGDTNGHTLYLVDEDEKLTKESVSNTICRTMGGIAAEKINLCENFGRTSDLEYAISLVKSLNQEGMGETLTLSNYQPEIESKIQTELARAIDLIKSNMDKFNRIVDALIEYKQLNRDQFLSLIQDKKNQSTTTFANNKFRQFLSHIQNTENQSPTSFANNKFRLLQIPPSKKGADIKISKIEKFDRKLISEILGVYPIDIKSFEIENGNLLVQFEELSIAKLRAINHAKSLIENTSEWTKRSLITPCLKILDAEKLYQTMIKRDKKSFNVRSHL